MKEPGGRIHGTLAQVAAALPSDAKVVSRYDVGTVRSACPLPEAPLKAPDEIVVIRFRTAADARTVVANADAALTSLGWAPVPDVQDVVWSKRAGDASVAGLARLVLAPDPARACRSEEEITRMTRKKLLTSAGAGGPG